MDSRTVFTRLAHDFRARRLERGLTQVQLAERAHVTRLTVIAVEKGSASVSASAYVDGACALGAGLTLVTARVPTMDGGRKLFADE